MFPYRFNFPLTILGWEYNANSGNSSDLNGFESEELNGFVSFSCVLNYSGSVIFLISFCSRAADNYKERIKNLFFSLTLTLPSHFSRVKLNPSAHVST